VTCSVSDLCGPSIFPRFEVNAPMPSGTAEPASATAHEDALALAQDIVTFWGSAEAWGDYANLTRAAGAFAPIANRARKLLEANSAAQASCRISR
jgi:hypothetical protein